MNIFVIMGVGQWSIQEQLGFYQVANNNNLKLTQTIGGRQTRTKRQAANNTGKLAEEIINFQSGLAGQKKVLKSKPQQSVSGHKNVT